MIKKKQQEISELIHKAILTKEKKNSARKIQFGPPSKLSTTIPRKVKLLNASTKSTKISSISIVKHGPMRKKN